VPKTVLIGMAWERACCAPKALSFGALHRELRWARGRRRSFALQWVHRSKSAGWLKQEFQTHQDMQISHEGDLSQHSSFRPAAWRKKEADSGAVCVLSGRIASPPRTTNAKSGQGRILDNGLHSRSRARPRLRIAARGRGIGKGRPSYRMANDTAHRHPCRAQ